MGFSMVRDHLPWSLCKAWKSEAGQSPPTDTHDFTNTLGMDLDMGQGANQLDWGAGPGEGEGARDLSSIPGHGCGQGWYILSTYPVLSTVQGESLP